MYIIFTARTCSSSTRHGSSRGPSRPSYLEWQRVTALSSALRSRLGGSPRKKSSSIRQLLQWAPRWAHARGWQSPKGVGPVYRYTQPPGRCGLCDARTTRDSSTSSPCAHSALCVIWGVLFALLRSIPKFRRKPRSFWAFGDFWLMELAGRKGLEGWEKKG